MKTVYYLIYQLTNSNINWVINVDTNNEDFIKTMEVKSKIEIYKIYKREIRSYLLKKELNYKHYQIFNIEKNDILVAMSKFE